jgi:hypothetical protein
MTCQILQQEGPYQLPLSRITFTTKYQKAKYKVSNNIKEYNNSILMPALLVSTTSICWCILHQVLRTSWLKNKYSSS